MQQQKKGLKEEIQKAENSEDRYALITKYKDIQDNLTFQIGQERQEINKTWILIKTLPLLQKKRCRFLSELTMHWEVADSAKLTWSPKKADPGRIGTLVSCDS